MYLITSSSCFRTWTNDTFFEEDDDEQMNENGIFTGNLNEPSNIEIQFAEGIDINELNNAYVEAEDANSEQIIQDDQDNCNDQQSVEDLDCDSERMVTERIVSEYTGEVSSEYFVPSPVLKDQNNDSARDQEIAIETNEEQIEKSIDIDNYISPCPGTSSSQAHIQPLSRNDSPAGKNIPARNNSMARAVNDTLTAKQQPPNNPKSSDTRSLSQQQSSSRMGLSASKKTITKRTADRQNHLLEPTFPSNQTVPPITSSTQQTASSRAHLTASVVATEKEKEKRIEAIRVRMESCLTAITNKVTEKGQRSPHAPFLSYLGTKLPNVPKEILPNLEREILELVDHHSK